MRRIHRILSLLTIFLLPLGISLAHGPMDDARSVTLDLAVTDKNDNPVTGLEKHNFKIFEDNIEQTITRFRTSSKPVAAALVLQATDAFASYEDVIEPAAALIHSLQPTDWIALVRFDLQPGIVIDFTRDKSALLDGLHRVQMPFGRETRLYDAVYFVLERMEQVEGTKAIFVISTGLDTISEHSYSETLAKAARSDVVIYSIGIPGANASPILEPYMEAGASIRLLQADNVMRSLAEATGGLSFLPRFSGEYRAIAQTVSADLKHRYELGYESTNQNNDESFHKLRVEVIGTDLDHNGKPDKLKVRYKKGY